MKNIKKTAFKKKIKKNYENIKKNYCNFKNKWYNMCTKRKNQKKYF